MPIILTVILLFSTFFGLYMYRFQGRRREIFKMDLVQFLYLFVLAPTLFVWFKSLLFFVLRSEVNQELSLTELFFIDTLFSVISFFVISAVAIHSLTKTFWLKRMHDPEFDIFAVSEYFHLWWSHLVIWGGAMVGVTVISLANLFNPMRVAHDSVVFSLLLIISSCFGAISFLVFWISDIKQANYMRLIKLMIFFFVFLHVCVYFWVQPAFHLSLSGYWSVFFGFVSASMCSAWFEKSRRTNILRNFLTHSGWGENITLFDMFTERRKK